MTYVIVSGLPASGKSTLARRLAPLLSLPVLDKDDILEALFSSLGVGDAAWRAKLSRSADDTFARIAPPSARVCSCPGGDIPKPRASRERPRRGSCRSRLRSSKFTASAHPILLLLAARSVAGMRD